MDNQNSSKPCPSICSFTFRSCVIILNMVQVQPMFLQYGFLLLVVSLFNASIS
jgi:hypothetical protein